MKINWNDSKVQSIVHAGNVVAFIFVSGGLTALADAVTKLHLTGIEFAIVMGLINAALAGMKKYNDLQK